jgi:hypothetical protein
VAAFVVTASSDVIPEFPNVSVVAGGCEKAAGAGVADLAGCEVLPNENDAGVITAEVTPTEDAVNAKVGATSSVGPLTDGAVDCPNSSAEGEADNDCWLSVGFVTDAIPLVLPNEILASGVPSVANADGPNENACATDEMEAFPSVSASSSSSNVRGRECLNGVATLPAVAEGLSSPLSSPLPFTFFNPGVAITELAQLNLLGSGDFGGVMVCDTGVDDDAESIGVLDGVLVMQSSTVVPLNLPRFATLPPS